MSDSVKKQAEPSILLNPQYVAKWFVTGQLPFVTYFLIALNIIAYVIVCVCQKTFGFELEPQQLITAGGNWAAITLNGQWWRLFLACFLHAGWLHIITNMLALLWVGNVSEKLFGHIRLLCIYVLTGLASSVCSILYSFLSAEVVASVFHQDPPMHVAVGASGAIMGVIGAYVAALFVHRKEFSEKLRKEFKVEVLKLVGLTIVLGIPMQADQGAHIGGLVCGFCVGYFMLPRSIDAPGFKRADYATLFGTLTACALLLAIARTGVLDTQHTNAVGDGMYKVMTKDYAGAIAVAKQEIDKHPANRMAIELLAMAYYQDGQYEKALTECRKSLEIGTPGGKDYLIEADYCHRLHLYTEEIRALKEAAKLDSEIKDTDNKVASALYMQALAQGDYEKSLKYGKDHFTLCSTPNDKAYAAFYYTVAARIGHCKDADNLLARCSDLKLKESWTRSVLAYENKNIDAAEFLKRATSVDQQTEAHAYIGFDELSDGHDDDAQEHLDWVLKNGNKDFVEYDLVQLVMNLKALR